MKLPLAGLLAATLLTAAMHAESPASPAAAPRIVMSWVPPYAIDKCRKRLNQDIDGLGPKDALTHLGLQFWIPTADGGAELTPKYKLTDATIAEFRDWGHQHGVRVLLCIYNYVDNWDWKLAENAFTQHREKFIDTLIAEMKRLDLDGIDIDLEGNGQFDSSKEAYVAFIRDLGAKLHAQQKQLTVDSFCDKWNAPSATWWADLFPHVDAINSMGYEEIGVHGKDWRAYAAQKAAAGDHASRLLIGVPGSKETWQGNTASEHLDWIVHDPSVGITIWDATFEAPYWKTREAWEGLAKMRQGTSTPAK